MPAPQGLIPILATPFDVHGELDLPSLRRLTEFCLASGVDGVAINGNASEAFALTATERRTVLAEVRNVTAGEVPVVVGVNAMSTVTAVEQASESADLGADVLMVLPPFMVKPSPGQLVDFYGEVAQACRERGAEVMLQDAPGPTGVQFPVETITELSRVPGITSVKVEAPPTAEKIDAVVRTCASEHFTILGGNNAQLCLEEYARGSTGTMPASEFVDLLKPALDAWNAGNQQEARDLFAGFLPLILLGVQPGIAWSVHKEVLMLRGIIASSTVRAPAKPLTPRSREALAAVLAALPSPLLV